MPKRTKTKVSSQPSLRERVDSDFTYHAPFGDQATRYEQLRSAGKVLAHLILDLCPMSREQSLALTNLEEAIMWANAAIARNEQPPVKE